ncbi:hypothetical protein QUF72_01455 [Desulfobacterales bacterium HSG2]|nr:hypothetical protein [Desulfobacterales bacterium HSG2]
MAIRTERVRAVPKKLTPDCKIRRIVPKSSRRVAKSGGSVAPKKILPDCKIWRFGFGNPNRARSGSSQKAPAGLSNPAVRVVPKKLAPDC